MDREYAARYKALYQEHWWWRAREAYLLSWLRKLYQGSEPLTILDVGCGDGLFFGPLSEFGEVEGIEVDPSIVSPEGPFRQHIHVGAFDDHYQPEKRFDLVLMLDVVEHVGDAAGFVRRGLDLLRPAGRLIITVPAFSLLWTSHDVINHHVTRYSKRSARRLADDAGMRIEQWRYFDQWTFAAKLLIRAKEAVVPTAGQIPRVPPAPINHALHLVSRLEHLTLGRLPVPFGSSLLIVGRLK